KEDFLRSYQGRLVFVHAQFELLVNILRHHNPILNDEAGSEDDTQHGQHIDRKVAHIHDEKSSDQGHRNIDERPNSDPPVTEEKVDDEYDQRDGYEQRFLNFTDRALDEYRVVHRDVELDILRNFLFNLLHPL